nr:hypothetical protein [uncultured Methanobrevibacter sp.]
MFPIKLQLFIVPLDPAQPIALAPPVSTLLPINVEFSIKPLLFSFQYIAPPAS